MDINNETNEIEFSLKEEIFFDDLVRKYKKEKNPYSLITDKTRKDIDISTYHPILEEF